ncbi:MAG: magnesium transporter [Dehalococcoidia bacterium]|nr:magnesium transporter [Dehalococcoidia bacterium]
MADTTIAQRELHIHSLEYNGLTWLDIEDPSKAEMKFLQKNYPFHPLHLEDCLSWVQLPKLDKYQDYVFLVLHFPIFNKKVRITTPSQVSVFVGARYVVTVHQGNLGPLTKFFGECQESEDSRHRYMSHSSGRLLYHILDGLVDYCFPILNAISRKVDAVEEQVFEGSLRETVRELSILRRDIISYRRIIRTQIGVLELLEEKEFPLLKVDPDVYFGDLADHIRRIWVGLEELKEVMENLSESHDSLTSHHINEVMRTLTVITTIMLPLIVVSGIYAQNIPLPYQNENIVFPILMASMVLLGGAMLVLFKWKRWI